MGRDSRTKTGWSRTEWFGPGSRTGQGPRKISKPGTRSDHNREKFQSLGPDRTRTIKIVAVRRSLNKGKPCLVTANPIRPALSKNRDSSKPSSSTDFVLLSSFPAPASCSKSVRDETKASEN